MLTIRPLLRGDEAHVLAMNAQAAPNVAPIDARELERLRALSDEHGVVDDDAALVGYILVFASGNDYDGEEFQCLRSELDAPFTYIDQVVVGSAHRSRGVGRRLYDELERRAVLQGHRWLCCEVNVEPPNPGSFAFHQRLGFAVIRECATRDGRVVALMKRAVPAAPRGSESASG